MRWRPFIVGMLVGGGLVAFGVVLGVELVAGRSPAGSPAEVTPSGAGVFGLFPSGAKPVPTPTPLPTPTPIPLVSCTVSSGQGNATIVISAPEPNGMCQAFTQGQPDLSGRAFALCQAAGLNPVAAAACWVVFRRYLGGLAAAPGDTGAGQVVCRGSFGTGTYEVRDTGNQYVGRAICGYLAAGVRVATPSPSPLTTDRGLRRDA